LILRAEVAFLYDAFMGLPRPLDLISEVLAGFDP